MKKVIVLCACFVAMLVLGTSDARAAGFGIYGSAGDGGSSTWTINNVPGNTKVDAAHQGVGFVFDTAVAQDKFFNYQLNFGFDTFKNKSATTGNDLVELSGLMISNSFGFGIVRTEALRMWMGPEIRLAWPSGSNALGDYDFFGAGVGPVLGMNFNLPGTVTFGVKIGYQFMTYNGTFDSSTSYYSEDIRIKEKLLYVNIGILFRSTGDFF
jgi:hypothetical protein